jgi:hypothetical protein
MIAVAVCWDQLFLIYDVLPATIPPAVVLVGVEAWRRWSGRTPDRGRLDPGGRRRDRRSRRA